VFPTGRLASVKARAFIEYVQGVIDEKTIKPTLVSFIAIFAYFE